MVNLSKRMHKLMPLWKVKSGAGAAILPPRAPAPQLTHLRLRIPNPCNGYDDGARTFWKHFLPSLRYHNLTLPIEVEQKLKVGAAFNPTLTLQFESPDKAALEQIPASPGMSDAQALQEAKAHLERRLEQERVTMIEQGKNVPIKEGATWVDTLRAEQLGVGTSAGEGTKIGVVQVKPQPAADPSTPAQTSPPQTMYTRTVTLGLRGRSAGQIWGWFKNATKARQYYRSPEDRREVRKMDRFLIGAEADRVRVKTGIDAMKREKEELAKAKEAAERMNAEV